MFIHFFFASALLQVSWIRHRDIHILTVGSYTYTSDQRFQAIHRKNSDEWTLQIKWAQKRDGGMYECQISTQPVKSFFVNLSVVGKQNIYFTLNYSGMYRTPKPRQRHRRQPYSKAIENHSQFVNL